MYRHSRLPTLLLALLAPLPLLAAPAQPQPQEVELRFLPLPQQKQHVSMDMKMQMTMNMLPKADATEAERAKIAEGMKKLGKGVDMDMRMGLLMDTGEAGDNGDYLMHISMDEAKMVLRTGEDKPKALPSPLSNLDAFVMLNAHHADIKLVEFKGLGDNKNAEAMVQGMIGQVMGSYKQLEGRHLHIGETAEVPIDLQLPIKGLPGGMGLHVSGTYTLKSIKNGVADIDVGVKIGVDAPTPANGGAQPTMTATGSGSGQMQWRIADHLPLRTDMKMNVAMKMSLPTGPDMDMSMSMQMSGRGERLSD